MGSRKGEPKRTRLRLPPEARRQQLIDVASRLLTEQGAAGVEISAVARAAKVTRPVVYRFFPTRLDLLQAVLDDFEKQLSARFQHALVSTIRGELDEIVEAFVHACCDTIDAHGSGAWHLMYARSFDATAARLGRNVQERLLSPWLPRIVTITGLTRARVLLLADIVVASGRAALDGWILGSLSRREAVGMAKRAVTALLVEFSGEPASVAGDGSGVAAGTSRPGSGRGSLRGD